MWFRFFTVQGAPGWVSRFPTCGNLRQWQTLCLLGPTETGVLWIGWSKCFLNQLPGFGTALISSAILWCTVWSVSLSVCLFEWWTEVIICCLLKLLGSWLLCRTDTSVHLLLSALHWTHSWHLKKSRTWRKQGHTYILITYTCIVCF